MTQAPVFVEEDIKPDIVITKIIHASIHKIFDAWIKPVKFMQWWVPGNFTNPVCNFDVRYGGGISIETTNPVGKPYAIKGTYYKVDKPSTLIFSNNLFEDDKGGFELENLITVTLQNHMSYTKLQLKW